MKSIEEYINIAIQVPFDNNYSLLDEACNSFQKLKSGRPKEIALFKKYIESINDFKTSVAPLSNVISKGNISSLIMVDIQDLTINWKEKQIDEFDKITSMIEELRSKIELENKNHNDNIRNSITSNNEVYTNLEHKRKELETYSDKIFDLCSQYDIVPSDINLDSSNFTVEELDSLYDKYLVFMDREEVRSNPITWFKSNCTSWEVQGIIMLIILFICFTPLLDFISILFFLLLGLSQYKNKNKLNYYSILMGITFNINPLSLGFKEIDNDQFLPEELTDDMLDFDSRFSHFDKMFEDIENAYASKDPSSVQSNILRDLENNNDKIDSLINKLNSEYNDKKSSLLNSIDDELKSIKDEYDELIKNIKMLGEKFSSRLVFNETFILGLENDVIEETVNIGLKNIIIRPCRNENDMNTFLQAMVVNALSNVFPGKLKVHIYDPNNFGRALMPLYKQDLNKVLIFHKDNLTDILNELTTYVQNNFKDMAGKNIQEFNKECEELGKTPKEFRLLIILSQPKTVEEDEALSSFFEYSASGGVLIWVVSDKIKSSNAFTFLRPWDKVKNRLKFINNEWCSKVASNFLYAMENAKTKSLMWQDFVDVAIPEKDIWKGNADTFIELYPGFLEGDPTAYKPYTIGNEGNVHIIGVGGTGAGKSVFLNHLISCITRKYDPYNVELWLCDFKGTEFKFYLDSEEYPFMLPHIKACLCTSDGDYATSLFKAIRNMADKRYEDMKLAGMKNMPGWNNYWRNKYEETGNIEYKEKIWPRVLFICDEFQVIFEKADAKNLESINADITQLAKVARAAGVHIFFTSQSMKKTVSADILQQFTLRFALRCDKDVSMEILGTPNASNITEKNGYLYVRSVEMKLEDQKRYRTPYLPDTDKPGKPSELRQHIERMYKKSIEMQIPKKDVITYEEATKHPISELQDLYNNKEYLEKFPDNGVFFLGMRMVYSTNRAPDNIVLTAKNNDHIFSVFSEYSDIVYFFNTIVTNISNNKVPGNIVIQSQIADLAYLTEADKYVTIESTKQLLSEKTTCAKFIDWANGLLDMKKKTNDKSKPVWLILMGWDKGGGFGVDKDHILMSKTGVFLQTCAEFNIHVIFINTGLGVISNAIIEACTYKICGKCNENESTMLLGNRQASKVYDSMPKGYIFVNNKGKITRDKLYISEITREIVSSEIVF